MRLAYELNKIRTHTFILTDNEVNAAYCYVHTALLVRYTASVSTILRFSKELMLYRILRLNGTR
jgi:hypothetical protein